MNLFTSSQFASAAATGNDWREASKKVLEALEEIRTDADEMNIGFLYITDALVDDATSILGLFKSVTGIESWVGCVGLGVCGCGQEYIDQPAISAMIGHIDKDNFNVFSTSGADVKKIESDLAPWQKKNEAMLSLVHGDPMLETDPAQVLNQLDKLLGGFIAGGMSSSRSEHCQFAGDLKDGGISGVVFSNDVAVSTALSQGCKPLGETHTITRADDHVITELDGRKPFDVFTDTLRDMAQEKTGHSPDEIVIQDNGELPGEFSDLFKGEVHIAFTVPGSDVQDFMVRNIIGIDPDEGFIAVSHLVKIGDQVIFVHRDDETVLSDLSHMLVTLRARVQHERGDFDPKGAIYISCVARAFADFGKGVKKGHSGEMALVREVIGDVPLAGFYAGGEISNHLLYGYTGVLILFL